MRLAWQVLDLLGSFTGSSAGLSSSALLFFVALTQHMLQGSQLALLCSIHHANIILFFRIKSHFCMCMCIYHEHEYTGTSTCVFSVHVCMHTHRCIHVSIHAFLHPNLSGSVHTHTDPPALGCSSLQHCWLGCGTARAAGPTHVLRFCDRSNI